MIQLTPFAEHKHNLSLEAEALREPKKLRLEYRLSDPEKIVYPTLAMGRYGAGDLQRADGLWGSTCFEAFWGVPGDASYWELNLSPGLPRWNLYFFESYRLPQLPRESFDFQLESLQVEAEKLICTLTAVQNIPSLELSLTCVLKVKDQTLYYASAHVGQKPDFHLRESFLIRR